MPKESISFSLRQVIHRPLILDPWNLDEDNQVTERVASWEILAGAVSLSDLPLSEKGEGSFPELMLPPKCQGNPSKEASRSLGVCWGFWGSLLIERPSCPLRASHCGYREKVPVVKPPGYYLAVLHPDQNQSGKEWRSSCCFLCVRMSRAHREAVGLSCQGWPEAQCSWFVSFCAHFGDRKGVCKQREQPNWLHTGGDWLLTGAQLCGERPGE